MATEETFSLAVACVVWVRCSTYLNRVIIHNIPQRNRLKGSTVIPNRHVWTKRYALQPSCEPRKRATLTKLHRPGRNETSNNRDSNYRDSTVFFQYLNINRMHHRVLHNLNGRNCYDLKFNSPASFQGQRKWSSVESQLISQWWSCGPYRHAVLLHHKVALSLQQAIICIISGLCLLRLVNHPAQKSVRYLRTYYHRLQEIKMLDVKVDRGNIISTL